MKIKILKTKKKIYIFFSLLFFLHGNENLDDSIEYILDGNYPYKHKYIDNEIYDIYTKNIIELNHSNNKENYFLKGLLEMDGEKSKSLFEQYSTEFPKNQYADDSIVKVAEYYYAKGLYIQSSDWYKKIITDYPKSKNFQKSVSYFLNSLIIAGNKDTADFYIDKLKLSNPKLNFSNEYLIENSLKKKNNKSSGKNYDMFSVQVAAYQNYDSANNTRKILNNEGFVSRIDEILVNGNLIYSVRVGVFKTEELARKEQKRLISRIGIYDSIIIELK